MDNQKKEIRDGLLYFILVELLEQKGIHHKDILEITSRLITTNDKLFRNEEIATGSRIYEVISKNQQPRPAPIKSNRFGIEVEIPVPYDESVTTIFYSTDILEHTLVYISKYLNT